MKPPKKKAAVKGNAVTTITVTRDKAKHAAAMRRLRKKWKEQKEKAK